MQCSALAGMPDFFRKSITQNRKSLRIGPVIKFVQVTHRLQGFRLIFRHFEAVGFEVERVFISTFLFWRKRLYATVQEMPP